MVCQGEIECICNSDTILASGSGCLSVLGSKRIETPCFSCLYQNPQGYLRGFLNPGNAGVHKNPIQHEKATLHPLVLLFSLRILVKTGKRPNESFSGIVLCSYYERGFTVVEGSS